MIDRWSLRQRIIAAHLLLAGVVCGAFAAAALHAIARVEDGLIDQRLARTANRVAVRLQQGRSIDLPPNVTLYAGDAIPAAMRHLPEGKHEVSLGGTTVNVLLRAEGPQPFALVDDDADFEGIQWQLHAFLAAAFVACMALAVLLGRWTAGRVIAPLTSLAKAVDQDRWPDAFPLLDSKDETGRLARAFAARTQALQHFLAREQWFVADVSHELRTPLTIMLGAAEVLCSRLGDHPEWAALAERIRRTAADTGDRVSALLLLSRAPETLALPQLPLAPIVQQEIERCQPLLEGKAVALRFEVLADEPLRVRPELAGTAIGNLLRNACQYTEQGFVHIRLERECLVVEDTGIGIPPALRDRVFERYVRADQGTPKGSGLGLAIVRRVAQHLDWTVSLEERPGGGSRFILRWSRSA
jgi:signal transduction histidine kinase